MMSSAGALMILAERKWYWLSSSHNSMCNISAANEAWGINSKEQARNITYAFLDLEDARFIAMFAGDYQSEMVSVLNKGCF